MKIVATAASLILSLYATSALSAPLSLSDIQMSGIVAGENFVIVNEVADQASTGATTTDPLLLNPWGLSQAPGGPLWVANNHSGTSTLYNTASWAKVPLNVIIPAADGGMGSPVGTVFTTPSGTSFPITANGKTAHSLFLFDTEDGTISGWSPQVDRTHAIIAVDLSATGANFKGLTFDPSQPGFRLYAADFANGQIDMFNQKFKLLGTTAAPTLPTGFAPFNVQALNGKIYVAYALRNEENDEVAGAGLGYIAVLDRSGRQVRTLVSGGHLNAPWGMAIAPQSFGKFAGSLLVGNFGDGKINAYDPNTGAFLGTLGASTTQSLGIDGLWALRSGADGTIIFSAGPGDEEHGLVGVIRPASAAASWAFQGHVTLSR